MNAIVPIALDPRRSIIALARATRSIEALNRAAAQDAALVDELIRLGCERAIELAAREVREPVKRKPSPPVETKAQPFRVSPSAGNAIAARLREIAPAYDWTLPNGSQLGAAGIADLDAAIATHRVKAGAHIGWVKFYGTVRHRMVKAGAHTVGEILTGDDLQRIKADSGVTDDQ